MIRAFPKIFAIGSDYINSIFHDETGGFPEYYKTKLLKNNFRKE